VYISYGPKSNADLLLLYGFSLDRNPFNSVELDVALDKEDSLYPPKKAFLMGAGQPEKMSFPLYNDRYPDELLQYLRLACLERDDLAGRELSELSYEDKLNDKNEMLVLEEMRFACERALAGYPCSEEDDTAIMSDASMFNLLSRGQRMGVK
ncbi:unnamed protein product, partial [Chrysoparadoxa australica]